MGSSPRPSWNAQYHGHLHEERPLNINAYTSQMYAYKFQKYSRHIFSRKRTLFRGIKYCGFFLFRFKQSFLTKEIEVSMGCNFECGQNTQRNFKRILFENVRAKSWQMLPDIFRTIKYFYKIKKIERERERDVMRRLCSRGQKMQNIF